MASGSFAVASSNKYVSCVLNWSSTTNVAGNYSTIYCELRASRTNSGYTTYGTGSGTINIGGVENHFSIASSQKITQNSNTLLGSGSAVIYHNDDGTKSITISVGASIPGASLTLGVTNENVTLDTIPRKSTLTVANGTLGVAQTLSVTRKSTSFTHTISFLFGTKSETICTKSTLTSIPWTPSLDYANQIPNNDQGYGTMTITTYNGNTSIGSNQYTVYLSVPSSVVPAVSFEVTEAEGYIDRFGSYIQGKSKLGISIQASGNYGSTIKSCNTSFDGKAYTETSFTTDAIVKDGELDLIITVTDSRGRTASTTEKIRVMAYNPPKITSLTIKRTDANGVSSSNGAYLTAIFDAQITRLDENVSVGYRMNEAVFKAKYINKKDSSDTKEEIFLVDAYEVQGGTYTFPANVSSSYDFTLIVDDFFTPQSNTPTSKSVVGGTTSKVFSVFRRGLGFAFGKVAELEDFLDVNFKLLIRKGIWIDEETQIDYIVEEGEKDGWFYRKWNSGIAECWKIYYQSGVNAAEKNYSGFYYSNTISVEFPFVFTNLPTVTVDGGSVDYINFVRVFGQYSDAASFTVVGLSNVTSTDITVNIRAIGRWK